MQQFFSQAVPSGDGATSLIAGCRTLPLVAVAKADNRIELFNDQAEAVPHSPLALTAEATKLAWQPHGPVLAVGTATGSIVCFRAPDFARVEDKTTHTALITLVVWSPDGSRLVTADASGVVALWKCDGGGGSGAASAAAASGGITLTPLRTFRNKATAASAAKGGADGSTGSGAATDGGASGGAAAVPAAGGPPSPTAASGSAAAAGGFGTITECAFTTWPAAAVVALAGGGAGVAPAAPSAAAAAPAAPHTPLAKGRVVAEPTGGVAAASSSDGTLTVATLPRAIASPTATAFFIATDTGMVAFLTDAGAFVECVSNLHSAVTVLEFDADTGKLTIATRSQQLLHLQYLPASGKLTTTPRSRQGVKGAGAITQRAWVGGGVLATTSPDDPVVRFWDFSAAAPPPLVTPAAAGGATSPSPAGLAASAVVGDQQHHDYAICSALGPGGTISRHQRLCALAYDASRGLLAAGSEAGYLYMWRKHSRTTIDTGKTEGGDGPTAAWEPVFTTVFPAGIFAIDFLGAAGGRLGATGGALAVQLATSVVSIVSAVTLRRKMVMLPSPPAAAASSSSSAGGATAAAALPQGYVAALQTGQREVIVECAHPVATTGGAAGAAAAAAGAAASASTSAAGASGGVGSSSVGGAATTTSLPGLTTTRYVIRTAGCIRGMDASAKNVLVWTGKACEIYAVPDTPPPHASAAAAAAAADDGSHASGSSLPPPIPLAPTGGFRVDAQEMAVSSDGQSFFACGAGVITVHTASGAVRHSVTSFGESDGHPVLLDTNGKYLAAATTAGRLRIYDAGRVEPRQIASGRFENSTTGEVIGHITAIRVSPDGTRLALLSQRVVRSAAGGVSAAAAAAAAAASAPGVGSSSGADASSEGTRFPDASVYSYCADTDTLTRYHVGPRKCPVHVAWDAYEPRLLAVQTERLRITDEDHDAGDAAEGAAAASGGSGAAGAAGGETSEASTGAAAGGSARRSGSLSEGKEADEADGAAGVLRSARSTASGGSDAAAAAGKAGAAATPGASAALSTGRSLSALLAADEPDAEVLMLFATADTVASGGAGGGGGDASASGGVGPDGRPTSAAAAVRITGASASGGLVATDVFSLEAPAAACLVGICTPYVHLLASGPGVVSATGGGSGASGGSGGGSASARLLHRTMRDFSGMEGADEATKRALTDFGYHMATGNMDDAYRSVKVVASPGVWENMARMCVKTQRLDIAGVCLGHMGHARGAKAMREMKREPEHEANVAQLAIQLGMLADAARLFTACGRFDLLNKLYQDGGQWDRAIAVATKHDRLHLRSTHYNYAWYLEGCGEIATAAKHYELAGAHRVEVPRMLHVARDPLALETYVTASGDAEMLRWMGQYLEARGPAFAPAAVAAYRRAGDVHSLVRIACATGDYAAADEIANETNDAAGIYQLARTLEVAGHVRDAIAAYQRCGRYAHALRLAKASGMEASELLALAMQADSRPLLVDVAQHFEAQGQLDHAVQLYHRGGALTRALDLCFRASLEDELAAITEDLGERTPPELLARCAEHYVTRGKYDAAVGLLVRGKRYSDAVTLCETRRVMVTEALADAMTPPKPEGLPAGEEEAAKAARSALLTRLAKVCKRQGSYQLATKKYTQAGSKAKAMKCLLKTGDTEKITFFATVSRNPEVYVLAANYLQTLPWHTDAELVKTIMEFYTKAKSWEQLSSFYEACAFVEIDEHRNYERALAALKEALKHAQKMKGDLRAAKESSLVGRIAIVERFVHARSLVATDPDQMVRECTALVEHRDTETAIRVGDVFALLIYYHAQEGHWREAHAAVEAMRDRKMLLDPFLEPSVIMQVYSSVGIDPVAAGVLAYDGAEAASGGGGGGAAASGGAATDGKEADRSSPRKGGEGKKAGAAAGGSGTGGRR